MFSALLRLSGLDTKLEELKRSLEQQADAAVGHVKSLAMRLAVSAGLMFAAVVLLLFAVLVGFIALYVWAQDRWGTYPALALIGGVLVVGAVVLLLVGLRTARNMPKLAHAKPVTKPTAAAAASSAATGAETPPQSTLFSQSKPANDGDRGHIEPFLYVLGRYAKMPKFGYGRVDDLIVDLVPRAEVAANEMVRRATVLVRTGDRKTMLTILGAAAAVGWLMVRVAGRDTHSDRP